jgi:hypothetical protein
MLSTQSKNSHNGVIRSFFGPDCEQFVNWNFCLSLTNVEMIEKNANTAASGASG